ncbi:hypothetical protein [Bradyrhizobium sp. DASA03007]|uniref:hypothetical protein n=1 Tax=unclassified Bradyrhizobium TaxID=2631580 RepID=UPI003F718A11
MLVYRVEHPEGGGPYIGPNSIGDLGFRHCDPGHPPPIEDDIGSVNGQQCGFASLAQFQAWFDPVERQELKDRGFVLMTFHTDTFRLGRKQLTFDRHLAKPDIVLDVTTALPRN